jgi:predicted ATPase/DNA-binding XRE family transcriptional regulator
VGEREDSVRSRATARQPRAPARFADLLRRLRRAAGFSQQFLAERANVSVEAISALERGSRRAPHRDTLLLIAAALDLDEEQRAELEAAADASRARGERSRSGAAEPLNNLPASLTSFVGREEEIASILTLLERHRLVTITGFGGIGKTRTALEAAARFYQQRGIEVWFVDLAPIQDGTFIASELATVLRPILGTHVDSIEAFEAAIKDRRMLLIFDNCEHLIADVVRVVRAILTSCRLVTILATSRERLSTTGEALFRLPLLGLPERTFDDVKHVRTSFSAVALFADRAEAIEHRFRLAPENVDMVVDICRRLDGIPLAIELAAARLPALGLRALSQLLKQRFVLGGGVRDLASRQQTMYSTIDWSYQLLGQSERVLLRRLAVFPGLMGLEAIAASCSDELLSAADVPEMLSSLVDKSLVISVPYGDEMRYSLLDSVRSYGRQQLDDAEETGHFLHRHAQWFADAADRANACTLAVPALTWINKLWPDFDSFWAALDWSITSADSEAALLGARIIYGFRAVWYFTGQESECRRWAESLLRLIDEQSDPLLTARLVFLLSFTEGGTDTVAAAEHALQLFNRSGERQDLADIHCHLLLLYTRRLRFADAAEEAQRAYELFMELKLQNSIRFCLLLVYRAILAAYIGRFDDARLDVATAEDISSTIGDQMFVVSRCWASSAEIELIAGDAERAAALAEKMLAANIELPMGALIMISALSVLAKARFLLGQLDAARESAKDLLGRTRFGLPRLSSDAILVLAAAGADASGSLACSRLLGFGDEWYRRSGQPFSQANAKIRTMLESTLTARLPTATFERARVDGSELTFKEATDLALTLG